MISLTRQLLFEAASVKIGDIVVHRPTNRRGVIRDVAHTNPPNVSVDFAGLIEEVNPADLDLKVCAEMRMPTEMIPQLEPITARPDLRESLAATLLNGGMVQKYTGTLSKACAGLISEILFEQFQFSASSSEVANFLESTHGQNIGAMVQTAKTRSEMRQILSHRAHDIRLALKRWRRESKAVAAV